MRTEPALPVEPVWWAQNQLYPLNQFVAHRTSFTCWTSLVRTEPTLPVEPVCWAQNQLYPLNQFVAHRTNLTRRTSLLRTEPTLLVEPVCCAQNQLYSRNPFDAHRTNFTCWTSLFAQRELQRRTPSFLVILPPNKLELNKQYLFECRYIAHFIKPYRDSVHLYTGSR